MNTKRTVTGLLASLVAAVTIAFHSPVQAQEPGLRAGWQPYQPVDKIPPAFERRCIRAGPLRSRDHNVKTSFHFVMFGIHFATPRLRSALLLGRIALLFTSRRALPARRLTPLGARAALSTDCYVGCWQSLTATEDDQGILCLIAEGQDVEMLTIVDGEIAFSEPLVADGGAHELERDDCRGIESARFSEDRRRLYTSSTVTCDGEASRRSSGIISMLNPDEWIDVRAIRRNGGANAWSRRYRRTSDSALSQLGLAGPAARSTPFALRGGISHATSVITIDDVIDASRNVDVDAVKGWLAEVALQLERPSLADLIRLQDAGVATAVIDMVVELSFPERFAVSEETDDADGYRTHWRENRHHHGHEQPATVIIIEENQVVPTTGSGGGVTGNPNPPAGRGRGGQVVAGKGYRKPDPPPAPVAAVGASPPPARAAPDARPYGGAASSGSNCRRSRYDFVQSGYTL